MTELNDINDIQPRWTDWLAGCQSILISRPHGGT